LLDPNFDPKNIIENLQGQVTDLTEKNKELNEKVTAQQGEIDGLNSKLERLQVSRNAVLKLLRAAQTEINAKDAKIQQLKEKIGKAVGDLADEDDDDEIDHSDAQPATV
jgi:predicted RNase H-like nuclease (RuvC/YqgF family)